MIEDVIWAKVKENFDSRGSFRELWKNSKTHLNYVQANLSMSEQFVLRGLHVHQNQIDHWVVVSGQAYIVLVDIRPLINGTGEAVVDARMMPQNETVTIPAGVAHGFLALTPLTLAYFVTNEYDGTDEHGFAWNDPTLDLRWPIDNPILSERDMSNPSLAELVESLKSFGE